MFRVRAATRKSTKRAISPFRPATDIGIPLTPTPAPSPALAPIATAPTPVPVAPITAAAGAGEASDRSAFSRTAGTQATLANLLEAETAAALTTKPWLRLERGLRIGKLRAFAEAYPGLSATEKESLHAFLVKANDNKQLNTKSQITYEDGRVHSIKGLKVIRSGDPAEPPIYKIDGGRQTKRVPHSGTAADEV